VINVQCTSEVDDKAHAHGVSGEDSDIREAADACYHLSATSVTLHYIKLVSIGFMEASQRSSGPIYP